MTKLRWWGFPGAVGCDELLSRTMDFGYIGARNTVNSQELVGSPILKVLLCASAQRESPGD